MERITRSAFLLLLLNFISGVECASSNSDIVGMAIAGASGLILLIVVVFIITVSFSWSSWIRQFMGSRGKVKMPKLYFKKKKEAKRRLLSATVSHASASVANGNLPVQSVDRVNENGKQASWVHGWSQRSNVFSNDYEEKDATMDLEEEKDEEFRIETVLVDNEVLDVGPYSSVQPNEQPIEGEVYSDPYIYTTVDRSSIKRDTNKNTVDTTEVTEMVATTSGTMEITDEVGEATTSFADTLVRL